jgi:ActR/RegA family two-component response regulator
MTTITAADRQELIKVKGLVVDDDDVWQETFAGHLADAGLEPTTVSTRAAAERILERQFFHLALVDLSLIGDDNRDGLGIIRKIHQQLREGTVSLLLTAYGTVEEGAEAKDYGALAAVAKARIDYASLQLTVQRAVEAATRNLSKHQPGLNLLSGPGLPEDREIHESKIVSIMGDYSAANGLATRLLRGLSPILRLKTGGGAAIDQETGLVSGTYWSKRLAAPFRVIVGKAPDVDKESHKYEAGSVGYEGITCFEVFRTERVRNAAGLVLVGESPPFESFEPLLDPLLRPHR